MKYKVRNAEMVDLNRIEEIYAYARSFMRENGNPDQWGNNHPPHDQLLKDIEDRTLYVVEEENTVHGVFFFVIGKDWTYEIIENGSWRSDTPYGTIHRIAGDGSGGVLETAVSFALSKISHVRIDTHKNNHIMQRALEKQGFQQRGIIYIADGSARIAYDKLESL